MSRVHIVIGDVQAKPGVPTRHLTWIGRYIVDQFYGRPDVRIIQLGDFLDLPSLSFYDRGKRAMELRRYKADVDAGKDAFGCLNEPIRDANRKRRKVWRVDKRILKGNHEARADRYGEDNAQFHGVISSNDFDATEWGWKVHDFLEPVELDGVTYSHYFYHPSTGRPYGGENLYTRLKQIGRSFTMGHQQGMAYAVRPVGSTRHHGLVLGSTYLHEEEYLGPQANSYWRGIVVKHQVERGTYDPMFVSLDYLCRRYEGRTLKGYMRG